jgi:hypothetical protein
MSKVEIKHNGAVWSGGRFYGTIKAGDGPEYKRPKSGAYTVQIFAVDDRGGHIQPVWHTSMDRNALASSAVHYPGVLSFKGPSAFRGFIEWMRKLTSRP